MWYEIVLKCILQVCDPNLLSEFDKLMRLERKRDDLENERTELENYIKYLERQPTGNAIQPLMDASDDMMKLMPRYTKEMKTLIPDIEAAAAALEDSLVRKGHRKDARASMLTTESINNIGFGNQFGDATKKFLSEIQDKDCQKILDVINDMSTRNLVKFARDLHRAHEEALCCIDNAAERKKENFDLLIALHGIIAATMVTISQREMEFDAELKEYEQLVQTVVSIRDESTQGNDISTGVTTKAKEAFLKFTQSTTELTDNYDSMVTDPKEECVNKNGASAMLFVVLVALFTILGEYGKSMENVHHSHIDLRNIEVYLRRFALELKVPQEYRKRRGGPLCNLRRHNARVIHDPQRHEGAAGGAPSV